MKPILGYWKTRGVSAAIVYQLKYQQIDFDIVEYERGEAPDFSGHEWLDVKFKLGMQFPNLPYG